MPNKKALIVYGGWDGHTPKQSADVFAPLLKAKGYDVEIRVQKGKIVFPEDRPSGKKLLQFLNEELFKGAITETLFETNSKREAD